MSTVLHRGGAADVAIGDDALRPSAIRVGALVAASLAAGTALATVWSASLVDQAIGENLATAILGPIPTAGHIAGPLAAGSLALVSGLTGTFTACNVAALGSIGVLPAGRRTLAPLLRSFSWLVLGAVAVAAAYGMVGATLGTNLPQLSTARVGDFPVRLLQSAVVFGLIGLALITIGLAAGGLLGSRLAHLYTNSERSRALLMGGLVGAFLVGRPFPLFIQVFDYVAATHNPFVGALSLALQMVGNLVVAAGLFIGFNLVGGGRVAAWFAGRPGSRSALAAGTLVLAGSFLIVYWCFRVPAAFGYPW